MSDQTTKIVMHFESYEIPREFVQWLINERLKRYHLEIDFRLRQEKAEETFITKVADNVERNYEDKYDGTGMQLWAA